MGGGSQGSNLPYLVGFLLLIGLALAVFGVVYYRRGSARFAAAKSWVQTQGTIISSAITTHTQMTNDMVSTSYRAQAAYRYRAAGAEREGSRVFLCARTDWNSEKQAQTWLAANPVGATVPVWFDPGNPTDSALTLNKPSLVAAIVLTTVGAAAAILALYLLTQLR
jgi:hypothetical protein